MTLPFLRAATCVAAFALASTALADDGHDHGAATPATGPALPRFSAVSETFELVGVLQGRRLTLYLDRSDDNAPVTDARIELEIGGVKLKTDKHEDVFEATLPSEPKPGVLAVTATVTAGSAIDLLAGELDLHAEAPAGEAVHRPQWQAYGGWAAAALAVLMVGAFAGKRWLAARARDEGAAA